MTRTLGMPHLLPTLAAVAIVTAALAGCSPTDPSPGALPSPTATVAATPVAAPEPADPAAADPTVLLTITATATSPDGAIAELTQVVHVPVTATQSQAADETALDAECDGWRASYSSPEYLVSDITVESTTGEWPGSVAVVSLNGSPVFTGAESPFQAYCSSVQVTVGNSRGVTPIATGGWESVEYGFGIATEAGSDVPGPTDTLLSECTITFGASAAASPTAAAWAALAHDSLECMFRP